MKIKMDKLSKFERTRILSARAMEIANGAKPKVDVDMTNMLNRDYVKIAEMELEAGVLELELYKN